MRTSGVQSAVAPREARPPGCYEKMDPGSGFDGSDGTVRRDCVGSLASPRPPSGLLRFQGDCFAPADHAASRKDDPVIRGLDGRGVLHGGLLHRVGGLQPTSSSTSVDQWLQYRELRGGTALSRGLAGRVSSVRGLSLAGQGLAPRQHGRFDQPHPSHLLDGHLELRPSMRNGWAKSPLREISSWLGDWEENSRAKARRRRGGRGGCLLLPVLGSLRLGGFAFPVCAGTERREKATKPRSRKGDGREIRLSPRLRLDPAGEGTHG
jgi:hypothetical protein